MTTITGRPRHKLVAAEVRAAMGRAQKNQADLAQMLGISGPSASELYRGNVPISLDRLDAIADWLDMRVADLLGDHAPHGSERRVNSGCRTRRSRHSPTRPVLRMLLGRAA